jgi:hypothetical protein
VDGRVALGNGLESIDEIRGHRVFLKCRHDTPRPRCQKPAHLLATGGALHREYEMTSVSPEVLKEIDTPRDAIQDVTETAANDNTMF